MAVCKTCGQPIERSCNQRYCSKQCKQQAAKERKREAVLLSRDIPERGASIDAKSKAYGGAPWSYAEAQKAESVKLFAKVDLDEFFASQKHIL